MAAGRRGGTTSTIFRITSAKLMPIVVDVRAASDRRQLVQGPMPKSYLPDVKQWENARIYKLK